MRQLLLTMVLAVCGLAQQTGVNSVLLTAPAPTGVQNQFVSTTGTTGQTSYCYWVVAVYPGGMVQPNGSTCLANANSTLDSSNYNTVTWTSPGSAVTGYWVVRSTGNGFPGSGTTAVTATVLSASTFSKTDQSNTLNSFTLAPISNASAVIGINTKDYANAVVQITDQNGVLLSGFPFGTTNSDSTGSDINNVYSVEGSLTTAQINTGATVLAAITGVTNKVVAVEFQAIGGAFGACTLVQVVDTAGTPIVSVGFPIAILTQNTIASVSGSGVVFTTFSWQGGLTASKGLAINKTGSSCTTATSLNYRIMYKRNS